MEMSSQNTESANNTLEVPAPTAWPITFALGIALLFAGMVTSAAVGVLGGIIAVAGAIGWFRDVLPHEAHESVRLLAQVPGVITVRHGVQPVHPAQRVARVWLPVEIHPISAGVKGGLAGSVAMALLAMLYGVLSQRSIWYPINLLVAGFFPSAVAASTAQIASFNLSAFLIAIPIHVLTSVVVGLLYGAMLPMLPRRPVLLGGFIAPILWSGLIHSILGIVNPILNQRIDWVWFVASQVGFGIVAGIVVSRQERIRTWQRLPLSVRLGMEASGMAEEDRGKDETR